MKTAIATAVVWLYAVSAFPQPQSVWIEDHPNEEVLTLVAGGKTTLLYLAGAVHADGPVVAVGKHNHLVRYVGQRIAERLGNALVLPINPYAQADAQLHGRPGSPGAGTISISDDLFIALTKAVVTSALTAVRESKGLVGGGFKNVIVMGDHTATQAPLKKVAADLDEEWNSKGVRVFYVNLGSKDFPVESLKKMNQGAPVQRSTPIEDEVELWAIDPKWIREDKIPAEDRRFASPELGKSFVEHKISSMVEQIRKLAAGTQ